jgi:hypothetical protein
MPNAADIQWFKQQFHGAIEAAVADTPFDLDMMTALACQETGEVWPLLRKKPLTVQQILALCVGDTLDSSGGRGAFPQTKADLIAKRDGEQMFDIARDALVRVAEHCSSYRGAAKHSNKFCHGFGIFQYDLQFFLTDPDYFLQKKYENFDETLGKALTELRAALKKTPFAQNKSLSDFEMAAVAVAYNTGSFKPNKGLKQGFFDKGSRKFYGELIFDFIRLSRTVAAPGAQAALAQPTPGNAIVPPPTPVAAAGATHRVATLAGMLRLRSAPAISAPTTANVIGHLPDGHLVRAVGGKETKGFREVETNLAGAHLRGFAAAKHLQPATGNIEAALPAAAPPTEGLVAVYMPRKAGVITKRSEVAGPHSLNEPNQPGRKGTTPDELRTELAAIIDWLDVAKKAFKRYRPHEGLTFCNIYAHDYCYLAGVYLPRVWWTQKAIEVIAKGEKVGPLYGDTIDEIRANGLFRWLRDFGSRFGWRQTGTLSELQQEANQGAISLIVARRKEDGRSGHIVMVVAETQEHRARRDGAGEVIAPLQSQAGATNFSYGTSTLNWWKDDRFAESAFWLHS